MRYQVVIFYRIQFHSFFMQAKTEKVSEDSVSQPIAEQNKFKVLPFDASIPNFGINQQNLEPNVETSRQPFNESDSDSQRSDKFLKRHEISADKKQKLLKKKQIKLQQQLKLSSEDIKSKSTSEINQPINEAIISLNTTLNNSLKKLSQIIPADHGPVKKYRISEGIQDSDQQNYCKEPFKFPYINHYIAVYGEEYLKTMEVLDKARELKKENAQGTYINCDVRYFNWNLFIDEVGKFDVMLIDPPWRIKGAQQNDSQFMFSNCKFSLEYNTMSTNEIGRLPLHLISNEGFIFLWILNSQLDTSVEIMQLWGYELIDEIVWVKLKDQKINLTHGYYFMHSYEICLVGYKGKGKNKQAKDKQTKENSKEQANEEVNTLKVRKNINSNLLFAQVRQKSQKPEDLYSMIEIMFKGKKKIEIFARNHNLRMGLFSIGNQLGESYDKWLLTLECDKCSQKLQNGHQRFKSKVKANYDLCESCFNSSASQEKETFFTMNNNIQENIRHEYMSCNHCQTQPIWGPKFSCAVCHDYDLCENCFDHLLQGNDKFHPTDHQFNCLQIPVFGNGFSIHEAKCTSCYQNPIIGIYFRCSTCRSFQLCQKCFFERPNEKLNSSKQHREDHQLEAIFQSQQNSFKKYECFSCKVQILNGCYMCQNCYNFFFCESCYQKRDEFKSLYANAHKKYHHLTHIF